MFTGRFHTPPNRARARHNVYMRRALCRGNIYVRRTMTTMNTTQLEDLYRTWLGKEPPHINQFMNNSNAFPWLTVGWGEQ